MRVLRVARPLAADYCAIARVTGDADYADQASDADFADDADHAFTRGFSRIPRIQTLDADDADHADQASDADHADDADQVLGRGFRG